MKRASEHRVTVISVSCDSLAVLPRMLSSLGDDADCVIVDNASTDQDALASLARAYGAHLICNTENLGFGVACNIGAAATKAEFLFFLNPDAELEKGALAALLKAADSYLDAIAFNPAITASNGKPYFKRRSVLLRRTENLPRGWPDANQQVPVLTGAALFARRAAFEAVNGFDPQIFLYHEDDDLALRMRAQCGSLMFVRGARVMHDAGNSTERSPQSAAFKAFHMGRSRVYAMRKHGLTGAALKTLMPAFAQLISPITLLSARKRAKQKAFLKGVISALR